MSLESNRLLPIYQENSLAPTNLHLKDGDPVKTDYVVGFLRIFPEAVELWQEVGLMRKISLSEEKAVQDSKNGHSVRNNAKDGEEPEYVRRMHNATEHMITVAIGSSVVAKKLSEKALLSRVGMVKVTMAALIHDASKESEYWLARWAQTDMGMDKMREEIEANEFINLSEEELTKIWNEENPGIRGLIAYDIASENHEQMLKDNGYSGVTLEVQGMVGHSSCPEMERLMKNYDELSATEREKTNLKIVLHYMDDIVTNPNIIDEAITEDGGNALRKRVKQNIDNPAYKEYNEGWKKYAGSKETAFDMQLRVGKMVENKLAELLGVEDPLTLPTVINEWIGEEMVA